MLLRVCAGICATGLLLAVASAVPAESTDVVVFVPVRDGKAGAPVAGVIVDPARERSRVRVPDPVLHHTLGRDGKATLVRPRFGGGYAIETEGEPTTSVQPRFGGGYRVETPGQGSTEVIPQFGGGYRIERSGAPVPGPRPADGGALAVAPEPR
jgi:hypothetical protein